MPRRERENDDRRSRRRSRSRSRSRDRSRRRHKDRDRDSGREHRRRCRSRSPSRSRSRSRSSGRRRRHARPADTRPKRAKFSAVEEREDDGTSVSVSVSSSVGSSVGVGVGRPTESGAQQQRDSSLGSSTHADARGTERSSASALDGATAASSGRAVNSGKKARDFTYLLPGASAVKAQEVARKKTWADVRGDAAAKPTGPQRPDSRAERSSSSGGGSGAPPANDRSRRERDSDRVPQRGSRGIDEKQARRQRYADSSKDDGPTLQWGKAEDNEESEDEVADEFASKANFGLSGALAKDERTGNVYKGIVLKWREPAEARIPKRRWRLYVFKGKEHISTLHVHRQSAYLVGREKKIADIHVLHPSCSSQHAVIQYRQVTDKKTGRTKTKPYIMDLQSTNGTRLNKEKIDHSRYIELRENDLLNFGNSTRDYILLKTSAGDDGGAAVS